MSARRASSGVFLAWAGIAVLGIGAWLAWPRMRGDLTRAPLRIVLVDVSKSALGPRPTTWLPYARERIAAAARESAVEHGDVCVVAYGSEVRTLAGPVPASEVLDRLAADPRSTRALALAEQGQPAGSSATQLAAALELASTLARARSGARVDVVGDGTYTGADPSSIAADLVHAGVRIVAVPAIAPERTNLGLGPLTAPRAIEAGAPLVVSFELLATPGAELRGADASSAVRVDIVCRGTRGERATRVDVPLPAGDPSARAPAAIVPLHADLGPAAAGMTSIEARAVLSDAAGRTVQDAIPEDDVSRARVHCAGTLTVGVLDAQGLGAPIFAGLQRIAAKGAAPAGQRDRIDPPGLQIVGLRAGELATSLSALDALITVDDPLDPDAARLVASFVTGGGGWLDVAGWSWIARRARATGPLASIAPLVPARSALGPRDVIVLADASGSMSGAPIESVRAALPALVDAALPQDDVEVRFFADGVSAPIRLSSKDRSDAERRRAFVEQVSRSQEPHGATHVWRALEEIASERSHSQRDALVILLSDGRDPDRADMTAHGARLRAQLGAARARLIVVATGADPDRDLLAALVPPGDALESAGDLAQSGSAQRLSRVFEREVAHDAVRTAPPAIEVVPITDGTTLWADLARAAGSPPDLARSVRAEIAPPAGPGTTGVVLATSDGEPLLAIRRAGSGLAAALMFQPDSDWAPLWRDMEPLAPLVRALAREHAARGARPSLREEDATGGVDGGRVCLDDAPPDLPAPARAHVSDGSGTTVDVLFEGSDPGSDPLRTRCAALPTGLDRSLGFWTFAFDVPGGPGLALALPTPRASEFTIRPRRFRVPDIAPGTRAAAELPASHRLAPWFLGAGSILLFAAALLGGFSRSRAA